ncbi:MAG: cell division protein FtsL [Gammaproteobacteria bacterium]|nr:cell division protein FtsL [Gammaproteobacteria bacterium]
MTSQPQQARARFHWLGINALLTLAVVLSAVAVVGTSHKCRQSYARLQKLQSAQWDMQENWSRLLLQESALATHYRVEQAAEQRLQMRIPTAADIRLLLR